MSEVLGASVRFDGCIWLLEPSEAGNSGLSELGCVWWNYLHIHRVTSIGEVETTGLLWLLL